MNAVDLYQLRHELRTPLTGMLGLAELLAADDLPGHAPIWLATLQACGQQLASLIDRSLQAAIQPVELNQAKGTGIDGGALLEQLICSHWPSALAGDTGLHLLIQPQARTCWQVDPVPLRQALDNLLANAIRFSPAGYVLLEACVLSAATADSNTLQLVVENSGPGNVQAVDHQRAGALQIADGNSAANAAGGIEFADRSYRMFNRGQGLPVVEQVCHALQCQLQRTFTAFGGARFVLQLPAAILRHQRPIKPFGPDLLRKLHCLLFLEEPLMRLVAALLTGLEISWEPVDRLEEADFQALPQNQLLIGNRSRLPVLVPPLEKEFKPRSVYLVAKLNQASESEWYVQPLAEPLFQAGLQTALLRCMVLQGMGARQA